MAAPNSILTVAIRHSYLGARLHLLTHFSNSLPLRDEHVSSRSSPIGPELLGASDSEAREIRPDLSCNRRDLHWLPIQARIRFKMNVITRNWWAKQVKSRRGATYDPAAQVQGPSFSAYRSTWFPIFPTTVELLPVDIRTYTRSSSVQKDTENSFMTVHFSLRIYVTSATSTRRLFWWEPRLRRRICEQKL